jgi:hypothetical protein
MLTDRDRAATRDIAYPDCVVAVVPASQAGPSPEEVRALRVLADAGLVPPLRSAVSRPAAARPGSPKNSSHPQLKPHAPRPARRRVRQGRAESRRIG